MYLLVQACFNDVFTHLYAQHLGVLALLGIVVVWCQKLHTKTFVSYHDFFTANQIAQRFPVSWNHCVQRLDRTGARVQSEPEGQALQRSLKGWLGQKCLKSLPLSMRHASIYFTDLRHPLKANDVDPRCRKHLKWQRHFLLSTELQHGLFLKGLVLSTAACQWTLYTRVGQ